MRKFVAAFVITIVASCGVAAAVGQTLQPLGDKALEETRGGACIRLSCSAGKLHVNLNTMVATCDEGASLQVSSCNQ